MTTDHEASAPSSPSRRWVLLVQAVLVGVLVVLAVRYLDRDQIALAFASVSPASFLIFTLLTFSVRMVAAWRWLVVARDHVGLSGLSFGFLLRVELLADFAGIWLQSAIGGEAVRVWKVVQRTGEKARGPGSMVLDRFVGVASLAVACAPFLVVLALRAPQFEIGEILPVDLWWAAALAAAGLALASFLALRYLEVLRTLARRLLDTALRSRFLVLPILISLAGYLCMVGAHYLGIPELTERGFWVAGAIAVLPRLAQVVPLSFFGLTAVEGAAAALGKLLGVSPETILVIVALSLTVRYLGALGGALAELALHGTRFFRDVRRAGGPAEPAMRVIPPPEPGSRDEGRSPSE